MAEQTTPESAGDNIHVNLPLEGSVFLSAKERHMKLSHNGLTIEAHTTKTSNKQNEVLSLTWRDVICAVKHVKPASDPMHSSFTLHYIHHKAGAKLQAQTLTITDKAGQIDKWINAVNEQCQNVPGRPKKVFVVVNPIGGGRRGKQIFQKTVAPLFDLAGMHVTVKFTEKSKHGLELGEQQNFSGFDVIVIVGGDGLYQEVLLGLTLQIQKKAGVDYNNPDQLFAKPDIPFGIIPGGTGNGVSGWCNGIIDEVTATLNIIRGENYRSQIFTVHSCGRFVTLCGVVFGYGEFSDLVKVTDDRRWMGKLRYPYSMIGMAVTKPRMFNCNFEYRLADKAEKQDGDSSLGAGAAGGADWTLYTGNSGPVCGFLSVTCEQVVDGKDVILDPFGKSVDLFVDFGCGRVDLLKSMYKCINGKNGAEPMPPKLERISGITGFRIKVTTDVAEGEPVSARRARDRELERFMDIDGEVIHVDKPELDIRVQSNFVSLYGCSKLHGGAKVK